MGTNDSAPGCGTGCLVTGALAVIIAVLLPSPDQSETPTPQLFVDTATTVDGMGLTPCMSAFADAASVDEYYDGAEDLFPAYSACKNVDEWKEAYSRYPKAIDGGNPVEYAMTVCANYRAKIDQTRICKLLNAPPPPQKTSLESSGSKGLLGIPLPKGSRLTESIPGNPAEQTDPSETYAISASSDELTDYFNREMRKAGWYKTGIGGGWFIEFRKGDYVSHVWISDNKFTLMGTYWP